MDGVANSRTGLSGFHFRFHSHPGHEDFSFGDTHMRAPCSPRREEATRERWGRCRSSRGLGRVCAVSPVWEVSGQGQRKQSLPGRYLGSQGGWRVNPGSRRPGNFTQDAGEPARAAEGPAQEDWP